MSDRDPRYDAQARDEAARHYRDGRLSERAIAKRMGLSRTRVRDLLDEAGVRRRRVGAPRKRRTTA